MRHYYRPFVIYILLATAACSSISPTTSENGGQGYYKVGQPYQVSGSWYYPREDYSYDETGIASWYGQDFHNHTTANGEIFNKNELTAAHKTLPLPTLARITNLDNGRSIVVRINDRGPFSGTRLIDVSQRAAQLLGFEKQGTAKVRVQVLADESKAIADAMRHYGTAASTVLALDNHETTSNPEGPQTLAAPLLAVSSQSLDVDPSVKHIEPIQTTAAIHQQLIETQPVAQVLHVPVLPNHPLYIQAGAFTVAENASKLRQTLSKFGTPTVSETTINGIKFYRVRVGPVVDIHHADILLERIRESGIPNARTVVE